MVPTWQVVVRKVQRLHFTVIAPRMIWKLRCAATKVVGDHQSWWVTWLKAHLGGVDGAFRGVSGQKSLPPAAVCPRGIPAPCHSHCPPPRCPHGHCPSGWTCPCLVMHIWGEDLEKITNTYRYQSVRNTVSEKQCSQFANTKLNAFCFAGWRNQSVLRED